MDGCSSPGLALVYPFCECVIMCGAVILCAGPCVSGMRCASAIVRRWCPTHAVVCTVWSCNLHADSFGVALCFVHVGLYLLELQDDE